MQKTPERHICTGRYRFFWIPRHSGIALVILTRDYPRSGGWGNLRGYETGGGDSDQKDRSLYLIKVLIKSTCGAAAARTCRAPKKNTWETNDIWRWCGSLGSTIIWHCAFAEGCLDWGRLVLARYQEKDLG